MIGFGWVECVVENHQRNGWVVKNKGARESTFATFYYLLSHAGIKKHNHSLTWFGDLSYSKLKIEKEELESNLCPYCGAKLREVEPYGLFVFKPPDIDIELLVEPEGWRIVESTPFERSTLSKEERREFALQKGLYYANKGVVIC